MCQQAMSSRLLAQGERKGNGVRADRAIYGARPGASVSSDIRWRQSQNRMFVPMPAKTAVSSLFAGSMICKSAVSRVNSFTSQL